MLSRRLKKSPRLRAIVNTSKDAALYQLVRFALATASHFSLDGALRTADRMGDIAYATLPATRRLALEHLAMVFGDELSESQRREIVRRSLRGFARSFCELAKIDEIRPRLVEYVELTGWEECGSHLLNGAIACSAHLGNWELLAAYLAQIKQLPVTAVARELNESRLNQTLVDFRSSNGVTSILRNSPNAGRQLLRTIKDGGVLAMLIDQDTRVPSITVPFLGIDARTPVAPAALAVRRNLPIIIAYSLRHSSGGIEIVLKGPLAARPDLERDEAVRDLTIRTNEVLSDAIRNNPDQWPWWHRRWRRKPQPDLDPDAAIL